jgi:cation transport regulator
MPYRDIRDLPISVKNHLPSHAQEIYLKTFNSAWDEYKTPSKRRSDASREEVSRKVAWAAVKKKYRKEGDDWVPIDN